VAVSAVPANGKRKAGSIGDLLMNAVRDAGPLTVKQIHERISESGKFASYHSVSSMVNYYLRQGYLKRTAPGTYALANAAVAPPAPVMTNGASLPKNGVS
ncbi:MAG: BlaI/MecI/CopY family transcriptional regulator, partial [Candidatus Binatus sp.]|uniref:BlaI/MecI/CopY family transcriptional regulator n=1 Tax=Candidatus Binatus sp. TaxID=2811406 RepID=UPI003C75FC30